MEIDEYCTIVIDNNNIEFLVANETTTLTLSNLVVSKTSAATLASILKNGNDIEFRIKLV